MTSKATDVQSYLKEVPAERRAVIEKLRSLCRQNLAGYAECMGYGMPGYKRNGLLEVSFASQKQYIALYVMKKDVVDEFRKSLPGSSIGKGCIRFSKPDLMDFDVIGHARPPFRLRVLAGESRDFRHLRLTRPGPQRQTPGTTLQSPRPHAR